MEIFIFRICFILIFLLIIIKLRDRIKWQKCYPTILFVTTINLAASFLTYHHGLWNYNPDIFVKTQTSVELINSFFMLPVTTLIYLSLYPYNTSNILQIGYIALWVGIFAVLEFIDHYVVGGIYYSNGWSWLTSAIFDIAMFSIIRLHFSRPSWAWVSCFFVTLIIVFVFDFYSGEFK
ncbi:CBO0543 family protein [Dendrosporobacter sp. 1207_IL3150]|uniref:CBO0543 family protein n=1 Tax=Dendrosporobacter sp. 1207_IL3150 TaxID=3084054 RepID=UPI002FDA0EC1